MSVLHCKIAFNPDNKQFKRRIKTRLHLNITLSKYRTNIENKKYI
jgi:hypothetical protein